jgi:hypothetical protein
MLDNPFTPRYCRACGKELKCDQVIEGGKRVIRVVCSGCGEVGASFSDSLSSEELADLMFPDKDHLPPFLTSDMISGFAPPRPHLRFRHNS